jgi:hypothetical protein
MKLAIELGKAEREARDKYGSVLFSRVKTEEDVEKLPQIDRDIFDTFRKIVCMKSEHEDALNDFYLCARKLTQGLKGLKLTEFREEVKTKKQKTSE